MAAPSKYTIRTVDAARRNEGKPPWVAERLRNGETLLMPFTWRPGGYYRLLKNHGYQLHASWQEDGIVVWAEKVE